jgi:putative membrane protein
MTKSRPGPRRDSTTVRRTIGLTAAIYAVLGYVLSATTPARLPPPVASVLASFPLLIAGINALALACLIAGWRAIRARRVLEHRRFMLAAAGLISLFLVLYVARVALGGTKAFPGLQAVRTYVYLPVLAVHIVLSIVSVPLVIYNLLTGLTLGIPEVRTTRHPAVGRYAVALWSTSLALGILVYLLLNVLF